MSVGVLVAGQDELTRRYDPEHDETHERADVDEFIQNVFDNLSDL